MSAPTPRAAAAVFSAKRAEAWEQMQLVAVAEQEEGHFETCHARRVSRNGGGLWFRHVG